MADQNEPCNCGAPVRVHYGPDIRFDPPCSKPMMYRAECSGDCINPSFTSFTRERALELWNERMRKNREDDRAIAAAGVTAAPAPLTDERICQHATDWGIEHARAVPFARAILAEAAPGVIASDGSREE